MDFGVTVVPATTTGGGNRSLLNPDGVFLSNGPGDPVGAAVRARIASRLDGKKPIFGICLGHQILGFAFGGNDLQTEIRPSWRQSAGERFAHRQSGDHFAESWIRRRCRFAAAGDGSDAHQLERRHGRRNATSSELPIFSVQYHPEAAPGPHDASYFFSQFAELIDKTK